MVGLGELRPKAGAKHKKKRVARGTGSGHGRTAGRGHKGQKSRSGGGVRPGFEGGQTPLYRRLPKLGGFKNIPFKKFYLPVNVGVLEKFEKGSTVNLEILKKAGILKKDLPFKILGKGELTKALNVEAHKFSKSAKSKIESAGGKVITVS
jgi:large subunit ribosomal protein L15